MSAYRSIFKTGNRQVRPEDFAGLKGFKVWASEMPDNTALHWWNHRLGITPLEFQSIFTQNLGDDITLKVEPDSEQVAVYLKSRPAGKFTGEMDILFGEAKALLEPNSSFEVSPALQGHGIGKGWIKSCVELRLAIGEQDWRFFAGNANGAYTWARAGVPIDMGHRVAGTRATSSASYLYRLDSIRHHLDPSHYQFARELCFMKNADDMIELARDRTPLPPAVEEELSVPGSAIFDFLKAAHSERPLFKSSPGVSARQDVIEMAAAFKTAAENRPATLSLVLGRYNLWPAIVDFNDAPRMKKIGDYMGGWKTIQPV